MPRAKLSEAERAERRRMSFTDAAYKHYDPGTHGFGSWREWAGAGEDRAAGLGPRTRRAEEQPQARRHRAHADLELLGLTALPADVAELKSAWRKAAGAAHPDHGGPLVDGVATLFHAVMKAYERLLWYYR